MSSITKVILNHVLRDSNLNWCYHVASPGATCPGDAAYAALGSDAADAPTEEELGGCSGGIRTQRSRISSIPSGLNLS